MRISLPLIRSLVYVSSLVCKEHCTHVQKTEELLSISSISTPVCVLSVNDIKTAFNHSETILKKTSGLENRVLSVKRELLVLRISFFEDLPVFLYLDFHPQATNHRINKAWNKMAREADIRTASSPRLNYKAESDPT